MTQHAPLIYLIGVEKTQYVKIGHTTNLDARMVDLQTGNPQSLTLLLAARGGPDLEQFLHERFYRYRLRGEWFKVNHDLAIRVAEKRIRRFYRSVLRSDSEGFIFTEAPRLTESFEATLVSPERPQTPRSVVRKGSLDYGPK